MVFFYVILLALKHTSITVIKEEKGKEMCRIESQALAETESTGAAERIRHAEDRLILAMERMTNHAINRRRKIKGLSQLDTPFSHTLKQRERIRSNLQKLAEAAC